MLANIIDNINNKNKAKEMSPNTAGCILTLLAIKHSIQKTSEKAAATTILTSNLKTRLAVHSFLASLTF